MLEVCDRIAVMYSGEVVEEGSVDSIFSNPKHPYTHALLSSVPVPDPFKKRFKKILPGEPPNPISPPSGCSFHPRCEFAKDKCKKEIPEFTQIDNNHIAACHFVNDLNLKKLW